jgi:hypothetical protein
MSLTSSRLARTAVVAIAAGGAVAGAVGFSAAAPAKSQHTLKFTTVQIADKQIGDYDVAANKETAGGKVVGFDSTSCLIDVHTHVAKCAISASRADGTFRGTVALSLDSGTGTGKLTGGTRAYRGATGTITAKAISQSKTVVTISYTS